MQIKRAASIPLKYYPDEIKKRVYVGSDCSCHFNFHMIECC